MNNINVTLTFMYDNNTQLAWLGNVAVQYNVTKTDFPAEIADKNKDPVNVNVSTNHFALPYDTDMSWHPYYICTEHETDILVAENIVVRIMGNSSNPLSLQAFGANENFTEPQNCFSDVYYNQTTVNPGNWSVMYPQIDTLTCARYMFGATMKVTYKDILGNTTTAKIFLDNSTSISSSGSCYNASVSSYVLFNLMLDDQTTNLTFTFNISDSTYDLVDIQMEYDPVSKYFPNHENISESKADIATGDISLFSTDSDHCYKCDAATDVKINGTATITFANMQLQPYGINNSTGVFSAVDLCKADEANTFKRVVVVVILALIALVIVAGASYFSYRVVKRKREKNQYNQLLS
jgi:hypothetical protein